MVKSSCLITFLSLFFLHLPLAEAKEENLKLVTSTGRAAIISDEQIQETRSRALEDALYSAALLGGAEIDGFTSVQAGTQLDDHFVVRPSSKIIDFNDPGTAILFGDAGSATLIESSTSKFKSNFLFQSRGSGLEAISIPCGFSSEGLPVAVQVIARPYQEIRLLRLAAWLENVFECKITTPIDPISK